MPSIEQIDTSSLSPYPSNAKKHAEGQVSKIAQSISQFGFNNPVLVDEASMIIAGHGRVLAAKLLGLKKVPCLRLSHLTEAQKRAYILADNRLSEIGGGWDEEILKKEIKAIEEMDIDLDFTGFDLFDRSELFDGNLNLDGDEEALKPEVTQERSCPHCGGRLS